jgi:hypothetical protein
MGNHREKNPPSRIERVRIGVEILALIGVGVYTWLVSRQVEISRDALRIGSRAYIAAGDARIWTAEAQRKTDGTPRQLGPLTVGETPRLEVTLTNGGNTPALNATATAFIQVRKDFPSGPPADDPSIQTEKSMSRSVVPKDGTMGSFGHALRSPLSEADISDLSTGKRFLVIYGFATYNDVFNASRRTEFCYLYSWNARAMVACPTYNRLE